MTIQQTTQADFKETRTVTPPRCSVILCTYNRRNLVLSALAALRRQTLSYAQFEVIVVDNGSTDGTLTAVRTYVNAGEPVQHKKPENVWRVQCLVESHNGLAYARNTGLRAASGEIAVFLDDDAIAEPHLLERLLATYDETGADAIGGRVELRWEASRPYWLSDDLLNMLGYFAPAKARTLLPTPVSFSGCNFSIKIKALRAIGSFSPLLSKRSTSPTSMEVADLCRCLRTAGYTLWYEPEVVVAHRVPAARLSRPYFVGRAYWQGRSEILTQYANAQQHKAVTPQKLPDVLQLAHAGLKDVAHIALIDRPLLFFAGKSTTERLLAAMAQARSWGHLQQRLQFIKHAPARLNAPAVFFVQPAEHDASANLLAQGLQAQHMRCTTSTADLQLAWLWRHRAYLGESIGILHFYRPGAFVLTPGQHQRLRFLIWLARRWGIRIVTTDAGGWWQSTHSLRSLPHRIFEHNLLRHSDIILAYTRQPDQLYPDRRLRRRVYSFQHPGFRGYYPQTIARDDAQRRLGLPQQANYIYLCLSSNHNEREILHLIDAFKEMHDSQQQEQYFRSHLLLVGSPKDKKEALLQRVALSPDISLFLQEPGQSDMSLYMGATDTVVLPHFAHHTAGVLETAMQALSFERKLIVPDLPRFRGVLPPRASTFYDPSSRTSLVQALYKAQSGEYHLKAKEKKALEAGSGWSQYAQRLVEVYKQTLGK